MRFLLLLSILLLFSSLVSAVCLPAERSLYVPAVLQDNTSEMVKVIVETKPGKRDVFISVKPTVGFYTQQSERIAADIAFSMVNESRCDVFLSLESARGLDSVDGPSAGAAITTLLLSALHGIDLRDDFSLTGTIESNSYVGPVGGIPLKAEATAKFGKSLFIVPHLDFQDKYGVIIVKQFYNISVVELDNIVDVFNLATSSELPESNLTIDPIPVQTFVNANLTHNRAEYFKHVSESMANRARGKVNTSLPEFKDYFASRLESVDSALEANQYYSAANIAFLLSIDEDFSNFSPSNFNERITSTERCLTNYESKQLSVQNFEFVGPANMRYAWAKNKYSPSKQSNGFISANLEAYYNSIFTDHWCEAAEQLSDYGQFPVEVQFDKSILKPMAAEKLATLSIRFENTNGSDDLQSNVDAAKLAFNEELYVASMVASDFVLSDLDSREVDEIELDQMSAQYADMEFTYLWPQLYQSHGKNFENESNRTSLRLYLLAAQLSNTFDQITELTSIQSYANLTTTQNLSTIDTTEDEERKTADPLLVLAMMSVLLIIFLHYGKLEIKRR